MSADANAERLAEAKQAAWGWLLRAEELAAKWKAEDEARARRRAQEAPR